VRRTSGGAMTTSARTMARAGIRIDLCYPDAPMSHGAYWFGYYYFH
jgi:hypothetical protein